jgi:hypothetical protein
MTRYSLRTPSIEQFACLACGNPYHATSHNQKYCRVKCYQYARQYDHKPDMPKRNRKPSDVLEDDKPMLAAQVLERRLARQERARKALERARAERDAELARWPKGGGVDVHVQHWGGIGFRDGI